MPSDDAAKADLEADALRALAAGDPKRTVQLLMDGYGTMVYRFCRQMLREPALADDALQNVFVQAFESLRRFDRRSSLRAWLLAIARNRCLDLIKAERRRHRRFVLVQATPEGPAANAAADEQLDRRLLSVRLETCIASLAPDARSAVLLRFHHELSFDEMAQVCRASANTLQARVARAMAVLRRCLEAEGGRNAA